jgi:photosystem II stability/assembly factor-like uncharacterized protein
MTLQPSNTVFGLAVASSPDGRLAIYAAREGGVDLSQDLSRSRTSVWRGGIAASIAVSPNYATDGLVLAGVDRGVIRSQDRGSDWQFLPIATSRSFVSSLSIASSQDGTPLIFAGTDEDGLYRSIDGGSTWQQSNSGLYIPRITALSGDAAGLWVTGTDGGLFVSLNDGLTWNDELAADVDTHVTAVVSDDKVIVIGTATDGLLIYDRHQECWSQVADSRSDDEVIALSIVGEGAGARELIVITNLHLQRYRLSWNGTESAINHVAEESLPSLGVCGAVFSSDAVVHVVIGTIAGVEVLKPIEPAKEDFGRWSSDMAVSDHA